MILVAALFVAYLIGSLSPAWAAGRLKGIDLRQHGSGNLGATNAGRVLGGRWFAIVFLADVAKGLLPVLAALHLAPGFDLATTPAEVERLAIATAAGLILGHVFTCLHGFKGGKAVATALGVLIGLLPLVAAITCAVWILTWLIVQRLLQLSRSAAVGPASMLAALAAPIAHLLIATEPFGPGLRLRSIFVLLLAALILLRHRSNLRALLRRG